MVLASPHRSARHILASLIALCAICGACSLVSGSSDPAPQAAKSDIKWAKCDLAARSECATVTVPLDWSDPSGATIELAVARIPASGDRMGSLIVNPGGPGGSGLDFLRSVPLSAELAKKFDLVSWDPRGVGQSAPLSCGSEVPNFLAQDPSPDTAAERKAIESAAAAVSSECAMSDGPLLAHMATVDVAKDLEAIRIALGDEQLNYLGYSYGTQIGQVYAQLHPHRIRTMVLDGVVNPAQGFTQFLIGQTRAFSAAFDANTRRCRSAGPDTCGVEDLAKAYDTVSRSVESQPLGDGDDHVGPAELGTAAIMSAYWRDGWRELGPALADALEGDGSGIRRLADQYNDLAGFTAYAAVVCTDSPPPRDEGSYEAFAKQAAELSPRLGPSIANELLPCATWPVEAKSEPAAIGAHDAPPILVVGNTGDPATPYDNAKAVADHLESGVLVTVNSEGHTAYGSNRCATAIVDKYLAERVVPEQDPRCT